MDRRESDRSVAGTEGTRRRRSPWRGMVVVLALTLGWFLPSSVGTAQTTGAQTRACSRLQAALARVGDNGSAAQALTARLQRFGCATNGPTTTVAAGSTTTSVHQDCVLPGGGIGPCPTTTTMVVVDCTIPGGQLGPCPSTTVGTGNPGGSTTTLFRPPTTFLTTTFPPSGPTMAAPSTTLPPCSSTTTSQGQIPTTTILCAPS